MNEQETFIKFYGQHMQEIDKMLEDIRTIGCSDVALPFMFCIYARMAGYRKNENYSWNSTPKESKTIKELRELTQRSDCDHTFLFKDGKWKYYAY